MYTDVGFKITCAKTIQGTLQNIFRCFSGFCWIVNNYTIFGYGISKQNITKCFEMPPLIGAHVFNPTSNIYRTEMPTYRHCGPAARKQYCHEMKGPKHYWRCSSDDIDISRLLVNWLCPVYQIVSGSFTVDFPITKIMLINKLIA